MIYISELFLYIIMRTLLDKITDSKYYSVKRFYGVVIIACIFVSVMFSLSIAGATPSPSATTIDYPEGMSSTSPFSEKAFQNHSLAVPTQSKNFTIKHGIKIRSIQDGIIESDTNSYYYSLSEPRNVLVQKQSQQYKESIETTKLYETNYNTYKFKNNKARPIELEKSILKNPTIKSVEMFKMINHMSWSATGTVEKNGEMYIKYKLRNIDTEKIPKMETGKDATGELLVHKKTGIISKYNVEVIGSSTLGMSDKIVATYFYKFAEKDEKLEKPDWISKNTSNSTK